MNELTNAQVTNKFMTLTDPVSLERGIGPECFGYIVDDTRKLASQMRAAGQAIDVGHIVLVDGAPRALVEAIVAERCEPVRAAVMPQAV
jgi:hypothetical protein